MDSEIAVTFFVIAVHRWATLEAPIWVQREETWKTLIWTHTEGQFWGL